MTPFPCKPGTFSYEGMVQCYQCSDGFYTTETSSTNCTKCPSGSYCDVMMTSLIID